MQEEVKQPTTKEFLDDLHQAEQAIATLSSMASYNANELRLFMVRFDDQVKAVSANIRLLIGRIYFQEGQCKTKSG